MSIPFAALYGVGSVGVAPIIHQAASAINFYLDKEILPVQYDSGHKYRNALPGPTEFLHGYIHGEFDREWLNWGFGFNNMGLDWNPENAFQSVSAKAWRHVVDSHIPKASLDQLVYWYWSGIVTEKEFGELCQKYTFKKGQWEAFAASVYAKFDPTIILANRYRGRWDEKESIMRLRRFYGCDEKHANDILYASELIPPPTDLVRFAVRDVFNKNNKITDPLKKEFDENPDLRQWFHAQGMKEVTIKGVDGNDYKLDVPMAYWMAHWQLPSPTQAYEFLHRLRPERIKRWGESIPGLSPFVQSDLSQLLKQADYAEKYRPWLSAISYSVPRLIDIRNSYLESIIDDAELKEKLMDRGYNSADADDTVKLYQAAKKEKEEKEREKKLTKWTAKYRTQIIEGYRIGSIERQAAIAALLTTEMDNEEAEVSLNAVDVRVNTMKVSKYIDMVKRAFFLGAYDGFQAFGALLSGNVTNQRATDYVQIWQRGMTLQRKSLSVKQIVDYAAAGHMKSSEVSVRLANLGYSKFDEAYIIQEIEDRVNAEKARRELANAKSEEAAKRAAMALIKQQQSEAARQIQRYASIVTLPRLEKWYKLGLIEASEIAGILTYVGWPQAEIQRAIAALPRRDTTNGEEE